MRTNHKQIAARLSAAAALLDGAVLVLGGRSTERGRGAIADVEIASVLVRECAQQAHSRAA